MRAEDFLDSTSVNEGLGSAADFLDAKPAKKQNKGIVGDIGTGLKRGVEQMPGMVTGLADIAAAPVSAVTGINRPFSRAADYLGEKTGFQPSKWAEQAAQEYSPEMQQSLKNVEQADGFMGTLGAIAENPRSAINLVAESLPSTLAGGILARGAMGAVTGAENLAALRTAAAGGDAAAKSALMKAGAIAGGVGEGAVTAGQQMAQTDYEADPLKAAGAATAAGIGTGIIGGVSGRVANKIGLADIEGSIASGTLGAGKKAGKAAYAGRIAGGALQEGALEEMPQSAQEQVWQNVANGKPWDEGVGKASAQGLVAGMAMGAGVNALPGSKYVESKAQPPAEEQQPIAGLLPAPNYTGTPGDQLIANDAERQAAIDAADANAAAVYAARDAFESQLRQSVTIINEPAPLQQRIDDMLNVDSSKMNPIQRANYEKTLAAAFSEQIGIRHDANQREVPFTMGEYLDAQVAAENAVRARPLKQNAAQQADARLQQVADEEGYVAPEVPVVGTLSAVANMAIQSGAHKQNQMQQAMQAAVASQKTNNEGTANAAQAKPLAQEATRTNDAQAGLASSAAQAASQGTGVAAPAAFSASVPALNAGNSVNLPATSISSLQDQLDKTEPFSEQSQLLTERLQLAVTDDAKSAIGAGEMPVYKVTDHVSVAIHPSAQKEGMIQVTRYTKDGVIGDSQYNSIDEAVRFEGLTHKPRIPSNEAIAHIENSIAAEAEYQKRKNEQQAGAGLPASTAGGSRPAPVANQEPVKNQSEQPLDMVPAADAVSQPKTDAAPEAKQDKAPAITPQHVENGESEPATAAVVEQSLMKGAANSPLDLRQERDLLLKKVDSAIAAAPTAEEKDAWNRVEQRIDLTNNMHVADTIGYRIFDVPGDGKFKVLNLKEALQRFRERVETNPGFRKPISEKPKTVADWQKTGRGGTEGTIKELLDAGEYSAAVEYAKQIGKPLVFGQYQDGSSVTVYTEAKPFERKGYDDFNMVSVRNPQGSDKVAWAVVDLNSGLTISSKHPSRMKAIIETNKALDKTTPEQMATAVRSAKANMPGIVGTQEELEQRWLVNVEQREADAQAKADHEHRKGLRSHRGMIADATGKPTEDVGKKPAQAESSKVDYKGFDRVPLGNGAFELRDGNMTVKVTPQAQGKYQATYRSAKSSPHLVGEQGAVDWAASYRDAARQNETDDQRYERIRATPVMQRDDKDVKWANEYKGRQQKSEAEAEAKKAEEQKAAIKADSINGFLDGKAPMQAGAIRNALNKQWRFDGVVMTARDRIESLWRDGKLAVSTYEENKIKPMSRRDFNRASQREQDAHEKKMREAGTKTVYVVSESELGKIAHDYAQHLLAKNAEVKPSEVAIELGGGQIAAKLEKPLIETTKESLIEQIKQQNLQGWKDGNLRLFTEKHGESIKAAMDAGKTVPDDVLADYPDLKESGIALLSPSLGRVDANKVDIAVASKVVADLLSGWRNAPDSRVVATFDDLPAAVRKEIEDQGEKTARGVFHGDTFYLIADEHASANEIEETIFHEVWAHYGLRSMLGANTTRELAGVFDQISASGIMGVNGKDAFRAFARRNGFNTAQTESMLRKAEAFDPRFTEAMKKRILVEELIAKVQEKGDNPSLKRKAQEIIGAIREWLRKVGFSGLMKYSDADLMRLVQKARDTVKYGKRGSSGKGDVPSVLMTAWHGSPHDHDKFDSSKIGTGEGAQAYGYGHYFAGAKDVAEWYRRKLSGADNSSITFNGKQYGDSDAANRKLTNDVKKWAEETGRDPERIDVALEYLAGMAGDLGSARQLAAKEGLGISHWIYGTLNDLSEHLYPSPNGRLYQVELAPTADEYLDWDKPLSEQSEFVRNALTDKSHFIGEYLSDTLEIAKNNGVDFNERGDTLYKIVSDQYGSDKAASDYLHSIGIRGIRYLDGSSRSAGEGNSNYVIFNDADVSITAKYNKASKDKLTPADTAIYGMAAEGKSAAEVLKFIASASRSPFNRQVAKLLMKTGIAPSVTVGDGKGWKMNAGEGNKYAAGYNPKSDTISLFRPASAERNMLHELMHAATLKALSGKGMAAAQMKALYQHVKKSGKLKGMYGMSDVDEFIAEAFSNPKFQAMLKQVSAAPVGGKLSSAWDWFVRVVRGILGLKQGADNALSKALEIGVEVMREDMALRKSEGGASAYTERMAKDNLDPDDAEAMRVQKAIEGKSTIDVAQWISVSGSPSERMIAGKVLSRLKMLESAGVNLKFKVAHVGDSIPRSLLGARGITTYKFGKADPSVDVWINGADVTGKVGTSVRTVLHELVHAATMGAVRLGGLKVAAGSKLAADVADLYAVTNSIIGHFNRRVADSKAGKITLTDFEQRMFNSENNAFRDVHETLAWALTDVDAQSYLESIPYQSKSAWTSFVSAIRQFLGLSSSADTALSEVLRVSEAIMSDNINDMIAMSNITGTAMATQESSDQMILSDHHGSDAIRYATGPKQTDSAAFRKWFGDSKVVDANGDPLVVYHGTGATDISEFKVSTSGTYGGGIYLTPEIRGANDYAIYRGAPSSTVYPVYAAIKNPASGSEAAQVASWKGEENAREELIKRGYDGVVDMRSGEIVAFYPEQIKSAIGNNGDFDPNNQDIRYNAAPGKINQTDTEAFRKWFGDSKVVDADGKPVVVYRADGAEFNVFDKRKARDGFFFHSSESAAGMYGGKVRAFYLKIEKPLVTENALPNEKNARDIKGSGFDGLVNERADGKEFIAVLPSQIKLAIGNNGDFSPSNPDIRYNVADEGWSVSEQAKETVMRLAGRPMLDPSDPFAAENARLREQDQSLWSKAKKQLRRYLAPGGLLPQSVFAEKIKRDSEFQAVEFDVRHLIGGLEHAVKADFGIAFDKLSKEQMRPITEALAGNVPASLPEATKTAAVAMRQYIDGMSTEYLKIIQQKIDAKMLKAIESGKDSDKAQAINEIELFEKIKGNIGRYVHRSYQAFDDPKWFEKVPAPVLNASRLYLKQGYMEAGETDAKAAQLAEVTLHEILKNGTAYDSMESFIAESKLGAKDLSVLMRRKEVPAQIRALLGEYPDARLNFTKSATKMGRLIWNTRFLDRVRDMGMGSFFFEGKDRPANATTQIAADGSEVYAPLNGLWTFPEIAQSFKDALGKEQMSDLYRAIVRFNGLVKYGKTVLAPTTAMRNWQSAMFFSLANGHFDLTQMKKSISAFREQVSQKATGQDLKYLRHLKQLGVVYDTPYAGEMARLMEDARMEELLSSDKGDAVRWFRKANQLAQGFYTFGDDFWKIIGFENEKAGLMKAGLSLQEAETEAAKRIRDTYPTYSMVGRGVQWLSRFPLAGTFVSFPAEIIRTSGNMLRTVAADLKSDNPKLRELGMKRAAGMVFVSAAFYSLAALSMAMAGVGDDEDEAIRDLAPEWQKNSTFLYLGRDEKGNLRYFDMSFLDPYGYWKRPITAMLRNQPWEDSLASGLRGMLEPFIGADIAAKAIFEAVANQKENGGKVYKEKDGAINQTIDVADHLRKALQPGVVGNVERLVKAAGDVRKSSGQPYSMEDELVALVGWRATTIDPKTALYYRSFEFTDAVAEARKTITETLRDANEITPEDIADAKARAQAKQEQAFKEMHRLVSAAESAGMSKMQIVQTLRLSNISQANIGSLMRGETPDVSITPQLAARAVRQASQMRGPEYAAEVFDRYRQARAN